MIVMPLLPIESVMSKKLDDLNAAKYRKKLSRSTYCIINVYRPPWFESINAKIAKLDKFTIVELTYHGKQYHGLASMALCDKPNMYTGLAVAYNRAFEKMCGDNRISIM